MSLLALDIGNTRLKWAMYASARKDATLLAHGVEFLSNIEGIADRVWIELPAPRHILGIVVASDLVRARVEQELELWDASTQWVVASIEETGLKNGYDHPARLGSDRWVAMIGARQHLLARDRRPGPCVLVMAGTAVTVEAIDEDGVFLGGYILPGHGIMLRALEAGTAGLHVPTGNVRAFPKNTSDALTSGGSYAIAGAVERMRSHLFKHSGLQPVCLVTGGAGWKIAPTLVEPYTLHENLIFEGLRHVAASRFGEM